MKLLLYLEVRGGCFFSLHKGCVFLIIFFKGVREGEEGDYGSPVTTKDKNF